MQDEQSSLALRPLPKWVLASRNFIQLLFGKVLGLNDLPDMGRHLPQNNLNQPNPKAG